MDTSYLYDEGEENWAQKYHLGCGGVYLHGYINCDISGVMALEHPDLVEQNRTTIRDYYARLDGSMHELPTRRATVCDLISDVSRFMGMPECVDKIIAIQVFEHFSPARSFEALQRWRSALRYGRPLILSVPDMTGTLALIDTSDILNISFALRHLRGRAGDYHQSHHAWYMMDTLTELLAWSGFAGIEQLPNLHFYPAIVLRAVKA